MFTKLTKQSLLLALFMFITVGLSSGVYFLTQPRIAGQMRKEKQRLFDQLLPPTTYDNVLTDECYLLIDPALGDSQPHPLYLAKKNQQLVAAIIESSAPDGYAGAIKLYIAADTTGHVYGVRVTEHHETPGLGDKIDLNVSDWITTFQGKELNEMTQSRWRVKKDGGDFDQFTGATITPRAVVNAVKRTVFYLSQPDFNPSSLPRCEQNNE